MNKGLNKQPYTSRELDCSQISEIVKPEYSLHGFLPDKDPLQTFPADSPYVLLDKVGSDLPDLLQNSDCRSYLQGIEFPGWQSTSTIDSLPALRLYYLRLGFIASAYINQIGQPACHILPANIAVPLVHACKLLHRPPILSYDGYALYNWQRLDCNQPIQLGNIDTLQNFVSLYDEHWFILIHVEIEAIAADILGAVKNIAIRLQHSPDADINTELWQIVNAVARQVKVLKRIPEKMDPMLYFKAFRPYIRFFEHVIYQGVTQKNMNFRGETGAQSSIMPVLVALMKIPHQNSILMQHLTDMRQYMPKQHRLLIEQVEHLPNFKHLQYKNVFNAILDNIITFREIHFDWANEYIHKYVKDPRGTGGTPYKLWLNQLIEETNSHKL